MDSRPEQHNELHAERERLHELIAELSHFQKDSERHKVAIEGLRREYDVVRRLFDSIHPSTS
jgi:hypothetical protein